jgi:hypothetical protein
VKFRFHPIQIGLYCRITNLPSLPGTIFLSSPIWNRRKHGPLRTKLSFCYIVAKSDWFKSDSTTFFFLIITRRHDSTTCPKQPNFRPTRWHHQLLANRNPTAHMFPRLLVLSQLARHCSCVGPASDWLFDSLNHWMDVRLFRHGRSPVYQELDVSSQ